MQQLNMIYTALMKGRYPEYPWGRRVSNEVLKVVPDPETTLLLYALLPQTLTHREAAAHTELLINNWKMSSVPYDVEETDPKNTYKHSVTQEFTAEELKTFNPATILYRLGGTISFDGYPELQDLWYNEPYWVDRLASITVYTVIGLLKDA